MSFDVSSESAVEVDGGAYMLWRESAACCSAIESDAVDNILEHLREVGI